MNIIGKNFNISINLHLNHEYLIFISQCNLPEQNKSTYNKV